MQDLKLEVVVVPVSDVDRSKRFYEGLGWRLDADLAFDNGYRSFATFSDPDGNGWLVQEIKTRLPGRGESSMDVATLTELLREAETRHGEYEPTAPKHHWSGWYAAYIVARANGKTPDEATKQAALHMEAGR
jgi:catechol 2,3-dioxygenase-like lactoylglutathione lyase family enzyme